MKFNDKFTPQERIELLEKWVLVTSYLYYEQDETICTDGAFNENSLQLTLLMSEYPLDFSRSKYYYVFTDFDGSTGFHLFSSLTDLDRDWIEYTANKVCEFILK